MAEIVTLVSKDGESTQKIADTDINRAEITRLRAAGWATKAETKAVETAEKRADK